MAVMADDDPLFPWLQSVKEALDECYTKNQLHAADFDKLLLECITRFKHNPRYKNDIRFLKIWFLYLDGRKDYENVFREMEENKICINHSLLYEWYLCFSKLKGGGRRKAEPLENLKEAQALFIDRMIESLNTSSLQKTDGGTFDESRQSHINPWSAFIMEDLLKKINPQMMKYNGYHQYNKAYSGKVALSSLHKPRNKIVEISGKKYQIKGCAGQGGFAKVLKAYVNSNPDEVVALKIQKPGFPWEFYMYRQLDQRISEKERSSFGFAHRIHFYSDCSILVCDFLSEGTLQDAINSYVVITKSMEEVLCIYYTIEMLQILESLHHVGIIHGDFKPDNLLIRNARVDLTSDKFAEREGPWRDQGLCLVDWGKGIDLHLFPENTLFEGDCHTSGFRCIEMQEKKPWTFQTDTYGLCAIVHMMLHGSYMEVQKIAVSSGGFIYLPKLPFKRYWNIELWKNLFTKLLNISPGNDTKVLQELRQSFQDYICSSPQLLKKLKELLVKQRASLCSS